MKVYFAHPISSYGTDQEKKIIAGLQGMGLTIVNPNDQEHQDRVREIQNQYADRNESSRIVMEYFVKVCSACDGCVLLPFPDRSLGAGIVKEVQSFLDNKKKVQEVKLNADGNVSLHDVPTLSAYKCLDVGQTRAMLKRIQPKYKL